jgi:hypothetical protein
MSTIYPLPRGSTPFPIFRQKSKAIGIAPAVARMSKHCFGCVACCGRAVYAPVKPAATQSIAPLSRDYLRREPHVSKERIPDERRDEIPARELCPMPHHATARGAGNAVTIRIPGTQPAPTIPLPSGGIGALRRIWTSDTMEGAPYVR